MIDLDNYIRFDILYLSECKYANGLSGVVYHDLDFDIITRLTYSNN